MKQQFLNHLKQGAVSMPEMASLLNITERQVRLLAQEIKNENIENAKLGWLLISGCFGYKITTDLNEIRLFVQKTHNFAMSLLKQTSATSKFLNHELDKELGVLID